MPHMMNPNPTIPPVWKHHPDLPCFVSDTGLVASEQQYLLAVNYRMDKEQRETYTLDTLPDELPQPLPYRPVKTCSPGCFKQNKGLWTVRIPHTTPQKIAYIHTLVMDTFAPTDNNKDKPYIIFLDGDKNNCTYNNLQRTDREGMIENKKAHGQYISQAPITLYKDDSEDALSFSSVSEAAHYLHCSISAVGKAYTGERSTVHGWKVRMSDALALSLDRAAPEGGADY